MPTVMVVDDDPNIRTLLRIALSGLAEVVEAADGDAALALVRDDTPDALVLDVTMPGTDGLQVLATLRTDPATSTLPVVMLTGRDDARSAGYEAGADAYLSKPFDVEALACLVGELLDEDSSEATDLLEVLRGLAALD